MKLKKGDKVIVIRGKDRGKTGNIVRAFPRIGKAIVGGVNIKKLHKRPTKSNQKGQIIDQAAPMDISALMFIDPKTNKQTRVKFSLKDGKKIRISQKSNSII